MKKRIATFILVLTGFYSNCLFAHDDTRIHPMITVEAAKNSNINIDYYLRKNLNFKNGLDTKLPSDGIESILDLLKDGSTTEDALDMCRASNHFHDPTNTKLWTASGMSDSPWWIDAVCYSWYPYYSNVTWATGLTVPTATPMPNDPNTIKSPNVWGSSRALYLKALTATTKADRETYFAQAFVALGQVLHLLQDMSVPAHVRNDFQSHLIFNGFCSNGVCSGKPTQWFGNPFEYYIKNNSQLVSTTGSLSPLFTNPRLSDFWDTDQYNGGNPSESLFQGLAEYTNANFFSNETIPMNNPTPEHKFPFPNRDDGNLRICNDYEPGSLNIRKYVSRSECPPVTEERTADHFAAPSLLNDYEKITNENIPLLRYILDDNSHKTYAEMLIPRAIGYSSQVLNYFFRGKMEVKCLPVIEENKISHVELDIKNATPDEAMANGRLVLTGRYLDDDGVEKIVKAYFWTPADGMLYEYAVIPALASGQPLQTIHYLFPEGNEIPIDKWDSIKLTLTYEGDLGNEKSVVDASGNITVPGAVIGKVFSPGKIKFNEEWNKDLTGNHNWFHTPVNYNGIDCGNNVSGSHTNSTDTSNLIKTNIGALNYDGSKCNAHGNVSEIYKGRDSQFPIPITANTSIQFRIPQMTTNILNPNWSFSGNWQIMDLWFTDGQTSYKFMISLDQQFVYIFDPNVFYFTFEQDYMIVDSIQNMFQIYGINTLPPNLQLTQVDFVQHTTAGDTLFGYINGQQQMKVDFVRVIEKEDTELTQSP